MLDSAPANSGTQTDSLMTQGDTDSISSETTGTIITYEDDLICSSAFQGDGASLSLTVPNATEVFSFLGQISVRDKSTWQISTDIYGNNTIMTKTVLLVEGDNTFYLLVTPEKTDLTTLYTITIRRRPIYTVSFLGEKGEVADSSSVEEGRFVTSSDIEPERDGFEFSGWDYDFTQPVQGDLTIEAKWTPVEYSLTYDFNGGEIVNNPSAYRIVDDIELNAPTREFYAFLGWYTADGEKIENVRGLSGSLLLTAQWECFYTVKNGTITAVSDYFRRNVAECVIPSEVSGETITGIARESFHECYGITSVTLPSSIVRIGENAFRDCKALTSVYYSGSIADWCMIEFASKPQIQNLYIDNQLVTDLVIPDDVPSIRDNAFRNCTGIISVSIPDSVTSIGNSAFNGCTGLVSITVPDSVKTIGELAFAECFGLEKAIVGKGVSCIEDYVFCWCTNLMTVILGSSVTRIGDGAFYYCTALSSLVIPDSVISIGDSAFECCTGLKEIVLSNSLKSIGEDAFSACNGISSITIPNSVTSIGKYAFNGCKMLVTVTIGSGVANIGSGAFEGCYNLVEIHNLSTLEIKPTDSVLHIYTIGDSYIQIDPDGFVFYDDGEAVIFVGYCGELTELSFPENYKGRGYSIHDCVFYERAELTSITIPDNVTGIGQYAFFGCSGLTSIIIPSSVTSIGEGAFTYCTGLTSVTILGKITSIETSEFSYCSGLTSITIPETVTNIGNSAFYRCTNLTSVFFSGTTAQWETISNGADWSKIARSCVIYCTNGEIVY